MKEKIIKVLDSYSFDFTEYEDDNKISFIIEFDTGSGEFVIDFADKNKLKFALSFDVSFDILSSDFRDNILTSLNLSLKKGMFTVSPVVLNPLYLYEMKSEEIDEIKIAKTIDEVIDTCGTFLKVFQMILSGKSLKDAIHYVEFETISNV